MNDKKDVFRDIAISHTGSSRRYLVLVVLAALASVTFYLRIIPILTLGSASPLSLIAPDDPTYNLHLIEIYVKNFQYPWFDPMTYYPYGLWTNWGPMFTIICSGFCYLFGAAAPEQIAYVSMFVPPLMAALCVPVAYFAGKQIGDVKTGLIAAVVIAFVGGQFFHRSVAGYMDHHTAEVFFSLLFVACYLWAIKNREQALISTRRFLYPGLPVWITIVSFMLFVLTMPTAILFAFMVFIFTYIYSYWKHDINLIKLNTLAFIGISVGYLLFIPWHFVINLDSYSIVHPLAYIAVIATGLIFVWKDGKYWWVLTGAALVALLLLSPVRDFIIGTMFQFFGQTQFTLTVQEARGWDINTALVVFNITIPLTIAGIFAMGYSVWKKHQPEILFALIWSLLITFSTIQHVRYEYYFAPVAAICSAFFISYALGFIKEIKPKEVGKGKKQNAKRSKEQVPKVQKKQPVTMVLTLLTLSLLGIFVALSVQSNYFFASNIKMGNNPEWTEPLIWMRNNTPQTGLNPKEVYTTEYTYPQERYTYPPTAYGVMSWWDYGHIIEYYAERPPNANPFQSGVFGFYGAANFFTTNNEDVALNIASTLGTKYVITDIEMATGKFWAMATWANLSVTDYQDMLLFDSNPQNIYKQSYYETIVARLHIFDGSYRNTDHVIYIEYNPQTKQALRAARVNDTASAYEKQKNSATPSVVIGDGIGSPAGEVEALKHFRLVHESPSNIDSTGTLRYVKVFEIVPGTVVKGDGLIATQVTTNTGRKFFYGQMSENGEWTLPYPGTYVKENGETIEVK